MSIKIGVSPLTNVIYAGRVNKKGLWMAGKTDVTDMAVSAVAKHLLKENELLEFQYNGKTYHLKVIEIKQP